MINMKFQVTVNHCIEMIQHSKGLELPKIVRGVEARPHEFPFMVSDSRDGEDGDVSDGNCNDQQ